LEREQGQMTGSEIIDLAQLQRTLIVGNGGSGKSRLAHQLAGILEVPMVDLDEIHWEGDACGSRRDETKARDMVAEAAAKSAWVIEGVYGWLARVALPKATVLIWLDISWEECRAGLVARGLRRGMTDRDHAELVTWAKEYWTRDNANSYGGHLRLSKGFGGPKLRFTERSQVDQFVSAISSTLGRRSP
jgi:adenylate kinase family enzyme